jgi:uncharacterized membrane protein (DUF485 family)
MLHEPAVEMGQDLSIPKKTKLGVILFLVYLFIYAGFVFIGVMYPSALGVEVLGGQNLAIIYGMGLIVLAAVMGIIYNYFCTKFEKKFNKEGKV